MVKLTCTICNIAYTNASVADVVSTERNGTITEPNANPSSTKTQRAVAKMARGNAARTESWVSSVRGPIPAICHVWPPALVTCKRNTHKNLSWTSKYLEEFKQKRREFLFQFEVFRNQQG